jgi:hypothetical protein
MKIIEKRLVDSVVDRICDVCEQSLMVENDGGENEECGELTADLGDGSKQDGKLYHLDLCESCFMVAINALKDTRRQNTMFDEKREVSNELFGLDLSKCRQEELDRAIIEKRIYSPEIDVDIDDL